MSSLSLGLMGVALIVLCVICYFVFRFVHATLQEWLNPFKAGQHYRCKVLKVYDGDTITVQRFNLRRSTTSIRMAYIDAPELKQNYGNESREALKKLVLGRWVKVYILQQDKYGRCVSEVLYRGKNINELMIKQGAAWAYAEYIRPAQRKNTLLALQNDAKQKKRGLWKSSRIQSPQDYRKKTA